MIYSWFKRPPTGGEKNTLPSLTVPGQEQSLQEIVAKYVRGEPVAVSVGGVYDGEVDYPDVSRMDYLEKLDLARQLKQGIKEFQSGVSRSKSATQKEVAEDVIQ